MAGTGGQREHLTVASCLRRTEIVLSCLSFQRPLLHLVSLLMVHLIFPMARDLKEASDTAVKLGLVTSLMVQILRVKL